MAKLREARPVNPQRDYLLTSHIGCGKCASPVVGSCLNRKYRYYRCRGTRPTASQGATCNARYIRADFLEDIVWQKAREVLEKPEVILAELHRQMNDQEIHGSRELSLDKAIERLRRKLRAYGGQEKRLVSLLRHDKVTSDYVLDELNQLSRSARQTKRNYPGFARQKTS